MAAVLLCAGSKGKRFCLPNSRIMIHQPIGGIGGQASDIQIHAREILKIKERLNTILSLHTGQPVEKIIKDSDRNFFMSSEEALHYGIIDEIIRNKGDRK
jgi:ATP-dependent Clp protease protease subunit